MSDINYQALNDVEKLDLLRLLYHDLDKSSPSYKLHHDLIVAETQIVYNRIKQRSN